MPNRSRMAIVLRGRLPPFYRQRKVVMNYQDPALRTYSANGMRSAEEWLARGRLVTEGAEPRTKVKASGKDVALFTQDQTKVQPPSSRRQYVKPAAAAAPAAV
jgi:hypothetical protein